MHSRRFIWKLKFPDVASTCDSLSIEKSQELGLKQIYEQDLEFVVFVKSITALAFVPQDRVESLFLDLSETFPEDDASDQLLSYFKSTYIKRTNSSKKKTSSHVPSQPVESL